MTVRANGSQIALRYDLIVAPELRDWSDMVDVDETLSDGSIPLSKVTLADATDSPILGQACLSGGGVALIAIDQHLND